MLYPHLLRFMSPRAARVLSILAYGALIAAILYFSPEPPADFHYGRY